jgi:hypothetical protein
MGQSLLKGQKEKPPPPSEPALGIHQGDCFSPVTPLPPQNESNLSAEGKSSPNSSQKEVPPPIEELFSDEEIDKYLAPHPIEIEPSGSSVFDEPEARISIVLMPHKHTLFCERKVS